jgi:hypothetical protein
VAEDDLPNYALQYARQTAALRKADFDACDLNRIIQDGKPSAEEHDIDFTLNIIFASITGG